MNHATIKNGPEAGLVCSTGNPARSHLQVWAIALAAGVVAGFGAWLGGELVHEFFRPQLFQIRVALTTFIQPTAASQNSADLKNATLVFTIFGRGDGARDGCRGRLGRPVARAGVSCRSGRAAGGRLGRRRGIAGSAPLLLSPPRTGPERLADADLDPHRHLDGDWRRGWLGVRHWHEVRATGL